jgi:Undecaprenyl-phosphate glucose phosphotransferase
VLNTIDDPSRPVPIQSGLALPGDSGSVVNLSDVVVQRRGLRLDATWMYRAVACADWVILAGFVMAVAGSVYQVSTLNVSLGALAPLVGVALAMKAGLWSANAYHQRPADAQAGDAVLGLMAAVAVSICAILLIGVGPRLAVALIVLAPLTALLISLLHGVVSRVIRALAMSGALAETAVIIGATETAARLLQRNAKTRALNVVGVIDDRGERVGQTLEGVPVLGDIESLLNWAHLCEIDQLIVTVNPAAEARMRELINRLRLAPNRVVLLLDLEHLNPEHGLVSAIAGTPAALISGGPRNPRYATVKRAQDLVIGSLALLVLAPIMAAIALAVRFDSPGPIIFRQNRHGFNNRIISVLKFRSMRNDQQPSGGAVRQVVKDDPRVTRLGAFLRKTSLDELPQLFNVLAGDMSLVGPRPHPVGMRTGEVDSTRIVAEYAHRHRMKPGMTGWAQINGSRGPVHTAAEVRERVRLDLEYIQRASLWFDLWIIVRTIPALLGDKIRIR